MPEPVYITGGNALAEVFHDVMAELTRAEKKHPGWPEELCHQTMVVNEEMGETNQAVLNYVEWRKRVASGKFDPFDEGVTHDIDNDMNEQIDKEMVQVAAMAIRFLYNRRRF